MPLARLQRAETDPRWKRPVRPTPASLHATETKSSSCSWLLYENASQVAAMLHACRLIAMNNKLAKFFASYPALLDTPQARRPPPPCCLQQAVYLAHVVWELMHLPGRIPGPRIASVSCLSILIQSQISRSRSIALRRGLVHNRACCVVLEARIPELLGVCKSSVRPNSTTLV